MAIAESERLLSRLEDASVPVDGLVVNRFFENAEGCQCIRCQRDAERHAQRRREIEAQFDREIRVVPQLAGEEQGLDTLSELGRHLRTDRSDQSLPR